MGETEFLVSRETGRYLDIALRAREESLGVKKGQQGIIFVGVLSKR